MSEPSGPSGRPASLDAANLDVSRPQASPPAHDAASSPVAAWLPLGPLAVRMDAPDKLWPAPWPSLRTAAPPPSARWTLSLRATGSPDAGREGPLRREPAGYIGPGFTLRRLDPRATSASAHEATSASAHEATSASVREATSPPTYEATVASPVGCMAALAAALIDLGPTAGFGLAHGATVALGDRGALVLGFSGAGKSTLAARHPARTLGANAALLWPQDGHCWAFPLPITGHGDAAIWPRAVRLVGGLWLQAPGGQGPGRGPLRWLPALASALGMEPPIDLALALGRLPLRQRGW